MKICIIGAGVVGLNSALEVQRQYRNARITLIADKFNEETTSDGAAGLFLPVTQTTGLKSCGEEISKQWVINSFQYYSNIMLNETNSGIIPISGNVFSSISQESVENEYMKLVSPVYRKINEIDTEDLELEPNYKYGIHLNTLLVPCRKFLPWAIQRFIRSGGKIIQDKVENVNVFEEDYDVLFNCAGLNSRYLFNDTDVIPIRGSTVQVRAPRVKKFLVLDDKTSYIIPKGFDNLVTLGGTEDHGAFDTKVDKQVTDTILNNCRQILPKLRTAPVARIWTGLRPYRPSIRVEVEMWNKLKIVHNYGHGGSGISLAPGTSIHAVKLFDQTHRVSGLSKL